MLLNRLVQLAIFIISTCVFTPTYAHSSCATIKCAIGTKPSTWHGETTYIYDGPPIPNSVTVQFFPGKDNSGAWYSTSLPVFAPSLAIGLSRRNLPGLWGRWNGRYKLIGNTIMVWSIRTPENVPEESQVAKIEFNNGRINIVPLDEAQAAVSVLRKVK